MNKKCSCVRERATEARTSAAPEEREKDQFRLSSNDMLRMCRCVNISKNAKAEYKAENLVFLALLRRLRFSSEAQRALANLFPASRGLQVQN